MAHISVSNRMTSGLLKEGTRVRSGKFIEQAIGVLLANDLYNVRMCTKKTEKKVSLFVIVQFDQHWFLILSLGSTSCIA